MWASLIDGDTSRRDVSLWLKRRRWQFVLADEWVSSDNIKQAAKFWIEKFAKAVMLYFNLFFF